MMMLDDVAKYCHNMKCEHWCYHYADNCSKKGFGAEQCPNSDEVTQAYGKIK